MGYELERAIEDLIAYERVRMSCDSFSKKAGRKVEGIAKGVYNELIAGKKLPENSEVMGHYETKIIMKKIRETKDALETFAKENPKAYARLNELIDESREEKEIYLYFGHKENCYPTKEAHFRVLKNLGIKESNLQKTYETIEESFQRLRRKRIEPVLSKHIDLDKKKLKK